MDMRMGWDGMLSELKEGVSQARFIHSSISALVVPHNMYNLWTQVGTRQHKYIVRGWQVYADTYCHLILLNLDAPIGSIRACPRLSF
jgi:hypothetical protein